MTDEALQIIARGPRAAAEAAAAALDETAATESLTYSILEEDEDKGAWRIDAFPTETAEADRFRAVLAGFGELSVATEVLADADWLAMALSGLPPVRAGRFFIYGVHDRGRAQDLFQYEYQLEMYKPAAKRRWGYYALPVLYSDQLVGKLDATADRKAGVLTVNAVHQDIPFTREMSAAIDAEIASLAAWLGLELRQAG